MKRDMELVRQILLKVEQAESDPNEWIDLSFDQWTCEVVSYHSKILNDAGLIEAQDLSTLAGSDWRPMSLTWSGHEFLDAARDETVWNKAMTSLKEKSMTVPFEVLKAVVMQKCREYFGVE